MCIDHVDIILSDILKHCIVIYNPFKALSYAVIYAVVIYWYTFHASTKLCGSTVVMVDDMIHDKRVCECSAMIHVYPPGVHGASYCGLLLVCLMDKELYIKMPLFTAAILLINVLISWN